MSVVDEVTARFHDYERALREDDVPALDAFFVPGDGTLRGDAAGLLVGSEDIRAFRTGRGGVPPRSIVELRVEALGEDRALLVAVTAPESGGRGLITQLWHLNDGQWRIRAAQVQAPAPAIDGRIWRLVGTPPHPGRADRRGQGRLRPARSPGRRRGPGPTGRGQPLPDHGQCRARPARRRCLGHGDRPH
jgi:hypothetical protein